MKKIFFLLILLNLTMFSSSAITTTQNKKETKNKNLENAFLYWKTYLIQPHTKHHNYAFIKMEDKLNVREKELLHKQQKSYIQKLIAKLISKKCTSSDVLKIENYYKVAPKDVKELLIKALLLVKKS